MDDANLEYRVRALEEDIRRNQETHKEFFERFERLGEAHARIDAQYAAIMTTLAKLETAIEEIKTKPAKRWESIVDRLIWAALASILGFVAAYLGIHA